MYVFFLFINTNRIILLEGKLEMNNNKNRLRDREKSNAELRKMKPKENANLGLDSKHIGKDDK
jgi:hypothetical protein